MPDAVFLAPFRPFAATLFEDGTFLWDCCADNPVANSATQTNVLTPDGRPIYTLSCFCVLHRNYRGQLAILEPDTRRIICIRAVSGPGFNSFYEEVIPMPAEAKPNTFVCPGCTNAADENGDFSDVDNIDDPTVFANWMANNGDSLPAHTCEDAACVCNCGIPF